ncbi:werner syndrome ATP-dependent helicase-like protein [Chrysochromulina tobinii]|uniref:3'-5' exonuclease n=1 Tax=Chrysochromulina tobinii TaxID=1460289 RepID=A0A0M0K661_9EUKA|nr:werner syndrome ATP-dependent helicase-like protein [Chrysochromulina tobinii]|eukprot:KOO33873.1 werner syndrome ATP-dependent helicase-like protein [Chrysochromulina sp. CCMP291]
MSQSSTAGIDMLLEIIDAEDTEPPPAAAEPPPAAAEPPPAAAEPPLAAAEPPPAAAEPPPAAARARKLPAFGRAAGGGPTPAARKLPRFDEAARSGALPPLALPVPIVYTRSEGEADELCEALVAAADAGTLSLVGFDIEWTVTYESGKTQRPAALVQLATGTSVYLFHVAAMSRFPERLATVIEDRRVLKAGSKVLNDMHKLRRDFGLQAAGLLEHQRLAAAVLTYGERPWSLSELVEACLRRHLPKEERVRTSAWESTCLDDEQTRYAALDAWASRAVALELLSRQPGVPMRLVDSIEVDPMWSRRTGGRQWLHRRGE